MSKVQVRGYQRAAPKPRAKQYADGGMVGGADFDTMQRKAGTSAAIAANQALAANPGAAANIGGSGMSFDEVAKKVGVAGATRALRGEPAEIPDQPAPPPPQEEPIGPAGQLSPGRPRPRSSAINFENSLGLPDVMGANFGRTADGIGGIGLGGLGGNFNRGGNIPPPDLRKGGPVAGGPPGTDTVPAVIDGKTPAALDNGEYVLPPATVAALGGKPILDNLVLSTTGQEPVGYDQPPPPPQGMATGGQVSSWTAGQNRAQQIDAQVNQAVQPQPTQPLQVQPPPAPEKPRGMADIMREIRAKHPPVQGYGQGGMPVGDPEEAERVRRMQAQAAPQGAPDPRGGIGAANMQRGQAAPSGPSYRDPRAPVERYTGPVIDFVSGSSAPAPAVAPRSAQGAPTRNMAVADAANRAPEMNRELRDRAVTSAPGPVYAIGSAADPNRFDKDNRPDPNARLPISRMRNSLGISPEAFNPERFNPQEYAQATAAWKKANPSSSAGAPAGPGGMSLTRAPGPDAPRAERQQWVQMAQKATMTPEQQQQQIRQDQQQKAIDYTQRWLALPEKDRGRMPDQVADTLGENRREWGSNRQIPRPPPSELDQDLYKKSYETRLGMAQEEHRAQLAGANQQSLEQGKRTAGARERLMKAAAQFIPEQTDESGNKDTTAQTAGMNLAEMMKGSFGGDSEAALQFVAPFASRIPTMAQIAADPKIAELAEPARTEAINMRYQELVSRAYTDALSRITGGQQTAQPTSPPR